MQLSCHFTFMETRIVLVRLAASWYISIGLWSIDGIHFKEFDCKYNCNWIPLYLVYHDQNRSLYCMVGIKSQVISKWEQSWNYFQGENIFKNPWFKIPCKVLKAISLFFNDLYLNCTTSAFNNVDIIIYISFPHSKYFSVDSRFSHYFNKKAILKIGIFKRQLTLSYGFEFKKCGIDMMR